MENPKNKVLFFETYLAVIHNSVGTNMFRNFYMEKDGKKFDATKDGIVSCAFFVSNLLNMFRSLGLIEGPHTTVKSTVDDMLRSGWKEIFTPRPGAVLEWEEKESHGSKTKHIGFYTKNDLAISNNPDTGTPDVHHWTFDGTRKVVRILWHPALGE